MKISEVFKRVLKDYLLVGQNKIKIGFLILFGCFIIGVGVIEPFFMSKIISGVEIYIATGEFSYDFFFEIFLYWGIFIISIAILKGFYSYNVTHTLLNSYARMYSESSSELLSMSNNDYLNKKQGSTYKIFDRGMESSYMFMENLLAKFLESIFSLIVIVIILLIVDYRMAFAALAMLPVMLFVGLYINKKTVDKQQKVNDKRDEAFGSFGDGLSNLSLVKTLTLEQKIKKSILKKINIANNLQMDVTKRWVFGDIYTGFIVMVSRFLVLSLGIYFLIHGTLTLATLFLFFSYIGYIYFPISYLFNSFKHIQKQLTGIGKFYNQLDDITVDNDNIGSIDIKNVSGLIEFRNVGFEYNKTKKVFSNLNLKIEPGMKVAFVGNTGAGKSTIVNLLFRFWDTSSGEILLDGKNIDNITKKSLRSNIGIVMQDNSLFNTTVYENLSNARKGVTKDEIIQALKDSEANFVFDMEKGLDTIIGERGLKLSGGEKQRLSIARLFLKNPKILVLDEATSALDNKTESLIQKALDRLMKGRTSIVIAHRLSTIQNADNIFVLDNGNIIEEGDYDSLMNKKGSFYSLANPDNLILQ